MSNEEKKTLYIVHCLSFTYIFNLWIVAPKEISCALNTSNEQNQISVVKMSHE